MACTVLFFLISTYVELDPILILSSSTSNGQNLNLVSCVSFDSNDKWHYHPDWTYHLRDLSRCKYSSSLARGGIFSNFSWCLSLHTESRRSFNLFFSDAFILIIGLFYCYWWCSRISLGDEEPDQILFIASKKFFFKTAAPLLTLWKSSFGQSPIR